MNKFDWSDLDVKMLQLLVAVVETGGVTAAAQRLGVTQSAVSHQLDKLRHITGEALFVKSGRGIVATARAETMAEQAHELLRQLQRFAASADFAPERWSGVFTIAANDFQRDLLLPRLAQQLRQQAPQLTLRIVPSNVPTLDMLRADDCQLAISPRPPDGADIVQKRLFQDQYQVSYDASQRDAPASLEAYLQADHATVLYEPRRSLELDQYLSAQGVRRRFAVMLPGFAALGAFVRGTPLLTTAPSLLARHTLHGLAHCPVPTPCPSLPMYLIWHARYQQDAAHRWLRSLLEAGVQAALT